MLDGSSVLFFVFLENRNLFFIDIDIVDIKFLHVSIAGYFIIELEIDKTT